MASSKKKTTFSKMARESKLRERRLEKQARKDARKRASVNGSALYGDAPAHEETGDAHVAGDIDTPASTPGAV
ncbi:MAG: hypothetical protein JO130_03340 [Solirubrobacterales bacterium]|nr:hypothetical protein [Solirubrobacterales bacterium]